MESYQIKYLFKLHLCYENEMCFYRKFLPGDSWHFFFVHCSLSDALCSGSLNFSFSAFSKKYKVILHVVPNQYVIDFN